MMYPSIALDNLQLQALSKYRSVSERHGTVVDLFVKDDQKTSREQMGEEDMYRVEEVFG
jgi:hypothetical protein